MNITAFSLAQRYVGTREVAGTVSDPKIKAMLRLDQEWPAGDEVPWCSAFVNWICWHLRLPRSKDLLARSWLLVGTPISIQMAEPEFDIVILKRNEGDAGAEDHTAPGHVGFYAGLEHSAEPRVFLLGGNQNDSVNVSVYPSKRVIGVRRLHWEVA